MAEEKKIDRPDTPLAATPITVLDDLQKASDLRLKAKREERKASIKKGDTTQSSPDKLQGLESLRNTLGRQYYSSKPAGYAKRGRK